MICLTCNIPCNHICPCCLESVFSSWHTTEDAKRFAKLVKNGDIDVTPYIKKYKLELEQEEIKLEKAKNSSSWFSWFR